MIRRVAVVIPAADEEERIGRCLACVRVARSQLSRSHPRVSTEIIVVLDGCRDGTAAIAAVAGDVRTVPIAAGNVGAARRAGASAALAAPGSPGELWLASTDADSRVPPGWLTRMLGEAQLGAHLVLGTALPDDDLGPAARAEWLRRHHLRDGHPHVHGASLGIRGDAYLALGGWRPLASGEDVDLARRASSAGHLRIARTAAIPVLTSARREGRAPRGFAGYLQALGTAAAGLGPGPPPGPAAAAARP